jgi:hypothetical protein
MATMLTWARVFSHKSWAWPWAGFFLAGQVLGGLGVFLLKAILILSKVT